MLSLSSGVYLVQTLTDTLCKELDVDQIKLNSKVLSLSYGPEGKSGMENWSVSLASKRKKDSQALSVDAVIMTVSIFTFTINKIIFIFVLIRVHVSLLSTWWSCFLFIMLSVQLIWVWKKEMRLEKKYLLDCFISLGCLPKCRDY